MNILSGISNFFGLEIGNSAIRLVELTGTGPTKSLVKYAYAPVDSKLVASDSKPDQQRLSRAIADLIAQAKVSTKNVAVSLPSSKVFSTVVDFDRLPPEELGKALRYQADTIIPTPIDQSKIDFAVLGDSPTDRTKLELFISSVDNSYVEKQLDLLEQIGLNVIAFEPNHIALARALTAPDATLPQMIIDINERHTDLVIVMNGAPRLTRAIPTGSEAIVRAAAQNLNIDEKQAEQFVFKFGLGKDKLEGRVYEAVIGTVDVLVSEVEKSIKFFQSRYTEARLDRIIVTGGASSMPEFPVYIANRFGLNVEIGNAWRNVSFSPDRQNELLSVSNHFGTVVGIAERTTV